MTVNDILILVRQRLGDMQKITFSDDELIKCLNDAMDDMCVSMSTSYDPEILKTVTLTEDGVQLPTDFIAWQGQFPLLYSTDDDNNTIITPIDPEWEGDNSTLKYFAYKDHFTSLTDAIPFRSGTHEKTLMKLTIQQIKPSGGDSNNNQGASNAGSNTGQAQ